MMWPGFMDYGNMAWMMFGSVALWVILIAVVTYALAKFLAGRTDDGALATLKGRLARGEISAEDYQSRRSLILGR